MPSVYEIANLMRGGNREIAQGSGDFIYIGEFSGGDNKFDNIIDKLVGGIEFESESKSKECNKCPQKKTMEWVSLFIKDYLKDISKHT